MFLARGNIQTVWDVLLEEKIPKLNQQIFSNNINLFEEREKGSGLTLFQMNTKFIMQFKNFMEKEYQQQVQKPIVKPTDHIRLNIHNKILDVVKYLLSKQKKYPKVIHS